MSTVLFFPALFRSAAHTFGLKQMTRMAPVTSPTFPSKYLTAPFHCHLRWHSLCLCLDSRPWWLWPFFHLFVDSLPHRVLSVLPMRRLHNDTVVIATTEGVTIRHTYHSFVIIAVCIPCRVAQLEFNVMEHCACAKMGFLHTLLTTTTH